MTRTATVQEPARDTARDAAIVHLCGDGQVGRALRSRLAAEPSLRLGAVHTRSGTTALSPHPPAILVDATAPAYTGAQAEAWIGRLEDTLAGGTSVVTCNKAPLALDWDRLHHAALLGGARLACTATVGGGTPILPTLRRLQSIRGIHSVEGTLSGTLSFVLQRLSAGSPLAAAVREAQAAGYAEPDPALDLDGTDAAAKAVILHNTLFARPLRLGDVHVDIRWASAEDAARRGARLHALARVAPGEVSVRLEASEGPPHGPPQTILVKAFHGDGTSTSIAGPGAGPAATAACLLEDLLDVASTFPRPGVRGGSA